MAIKANQDRSSMRIDTPSVLVTSGPTRAYLDKIRYIANTSTGALGALIVEELAARGIPVVHLYGIGSRQAHITDGRNVIQQEIVTVTDLIEAVEDLAGTHSIVAVVHAMAVLDYVPKETKAEKIPSGSDTWDVRLVKTPKVAALIRGKMPHAWMAGFKLESGIGENELVRRATAMMKRYDLDLVVANVLEHVSEDSHDAVLIGRDGILGRAGTKREIAVSLAGMIEAVLREAP